MSWPDIEAAMFSDVIELQRLESIDDTVDPVTMLRRYNLAQTQATLYRASQVRIDADDDFKTIVRHIKLAGLMHRIEQKSQRPARYRFWLDGPGSSLRQTTRYGVHFAKMLPMLLACRDWTLTARISSPRGEPVRLTVSPADGLHSPHNPPSSHDSKLEQQIEAAWDADPPAGWSMTRETALLVIGQSVFTPDFVIQHDTDNVRILVEVVGFWTPEYLQAKAAKLQAFRGVGGENVRWLLLLPRPTAPSIEEAMKDVEMPVVLFDKKSHPKDWIKASRVDQR